MLCSLPLFAALKKKYPLAGITLIAAKTNYQIPFFDINPYIERVLIFDKSSLKTILKFIKDLRSRKYQVGIVPSTIALSRTSHIINFISGAKIRVGVKSIDGTKNESHKYLNVKSDFNWKDKHQTLRNLDIVNQIGCDLTNDEKKSIRFLFTSDDLQSAENYLEEKFNDRSKKIIAFHSGAGKTTNIWPKEKFIDLIKHLHSHYKNHILLTSGWTDTAITDNISTELNALNIPHVILHNCPVKKLGAILSRCDLYVTNDTGTMHIAGHSDTKMISLFGPTSPFEWAPLSSNNVSIKSESNLIKDIKVDEVLAGCNSILNKS